MKTTKILKASISLVVAAGCAVGVGSAYATNEAAALKPGTEYMIVPNHPHLLNVLDLSNDTVYKTCPLPGRFSPGLAQISPDHRTAYILSNGFGTVYGVDLDSCKIVFQAEMSYKEGERAKSIFGMAISADGKELYSVQNPTLIERDHYVVQEPRFVVYDTSAGLNAQPVKTFPAPRQSTMMMAARDGSVYLAGQNFYKVDVKNGTMEIALPIREWHRDMYVPPDVLYVWPVQNPSKNFTLLYGTAKYKDEKKDLDTADWLWGYMNINLETGAKEAREFGPLTEVYFTGLISPRDPNIIYTALSSLTKFDIAAQKQVKTTRLDHTYYTVSPNHDGSKLYLSSTMNDIAIYDPDSLEKLGNIVLEGGDQSLGTAQIFIR